MIPIRLGWVVVALLLVVEWALFVRFFERELAPAYPTGYDQAAYLGQTYETYDVMVRDGLRAGLVHGIKMAVANNLMLHLQGALLLLVTGPNRLGALSLNFIYFAVLQCFLVYTLLWITNRWSVAFLGLGLLLTALTRFQETGGMADFRLDFIAFCLFGVFLCLAVRSEVFALRGWSVAAAFSAAMLILFRFQSAITMGATLIFVLAILGFRARQAADFEVRAAAARRARGLIWVGVLIAFLVLPGIWPVHRELIHYYASQTVTDVGVRAREYGAQDQFAYWSFYVYSLVFTHLGKAFCILAVGIVAVLFTAGRLRSRGSTRPAMGSDFAIQWLFVAATLFVPLLVLTFWPIRNPVVGGILVTPAIALVMCSVVAFAGRTRSDQRPPLSRTLAALATLSFAGGFLFDLAMSVRKTSLSTDKESVQNILQFCDEIAERSRQMNWTAPRYSTDRVQQYLVAEVPRALSYERHGFLIKSAQLLGASIQPVSTASALEAIKESDFAVISDFSTKDAGFPYPFNIDMRQKERELHAAADEFMLPLRHYQVYGDGFTLYMRPSAQVSGDSGGWITADGLTLTVDAKVLKERPRIELSGTTILAEHLGKVSLNARVVREGRQPYEAPAEFQLTVAPNHANPYQAVVSIDRNQLPDSGEVRIKLSFDKFFVPKKIGLNDDTRQLVIMSPTQVRLMK
jgi:hypothetical protein